MIVTISWIKNYIPPYVGLPSLFGTIAAGIIIITISIKKSSRNMIKRSISNWFLNPFNRVDPTELKVKLR